MLEVDGKTYWVFDTKGYEAMAENYQTYLKAIRQLSAVIDYYRNCINQKEIVKP